MKYKKRNYLFGCRVERNWIQNALQDIRETNRPTRLESPQSDIVLRARDQRWNWLGHIPRMDERRTVRQVLLQ